MKRPLHKEISPENARYLAGLFDGEGCITIFKRKGPAYKGAKSPSFRLMISLATTYEPLALWLKQICGGKLLWSNRSAKNPKWADAWTWHGDSSTGGDFLKAIFPYLIVKREEAEIAIAFQNRVTGDWKIRGCNSPTNRSLSQEDIEYRDWCKQRLTEIKQEHKSYKRLA